MLQTSREESELDVHSETLGRVDELTRLREAVQRKIDIITELKRRQQSPATPMRALDRSCGARVRVDAMHLAAGELAIDIALPEDRLPDETVQCLSEVSLALQGISTERKVVRVSGTDLPGGW